MDKLSHLIAHEVERRRWKAMKVRIRVCLEDFIFEFV
jgi:hypothetical protein